MPLSRQYADRGFGSNRRTSPSFDEYPFYTLAGHSASAGLSSAPFGHVLHRRERQRQVDAARGNRRRLPFQPRGWQRLNFSFTTRASHSELHRYLRIVRGIRRPKTGYFLRAESFYNVASEIDRLDEIPAARPHDQGFLRRRLTPQAVSRRIVHGAAQQAVLAVRALLPRRAGSRTVAVAPASGSRSHPCSA